MKKTKFKQTKFAITSKLFLKTFLLATLFFNSTSTKAQTNLDSLWTIWEDETRHDTARSLTLLRIIQNGYLQSQPDSALHFSKISYDFAKSIGYDYSIGFSLTFIGRSNYYLGNNEEAIKYFTKSMDFYKSIGDKELAYQLTRELADAYRRLRKSDEQMQEYRKALNYKISINDTVPVSMYYLLIGEVHYDKNNVDSAHWYYRKSYEKAKLVGSKNMMANADLRSGTLYAQNNQYEKALSHLYKAVKLNEEINYKDNLISCLSIVTNVHESLGNFDKAFEYLDKSLKIAKELKGRDDLMINIFSNYGSLYSKNKNYKKAYEYFLKECKLTVKVYGNSVDYMQALSRLSENLLFQENLPEAIKYIEQYGKLAKKFNHPRGLYAYYSDKSRYYSRLKQHDKAIQYGEKSLALAKEIGVDSDIAAVSVNLSSAYAQVDNYKKALELFMVNYMIKDSINREGNQRALFDQQYKYEYEKQAFADSLEFAQKETITNLQLEKNEATLSQQRLALIATILGLLLLGALAYFFYQSKKRQEAEADRVKELDAFKSTFYTNITHEFRTPLTVILGMANQIEERPQQYLEEGIQLIKRNGKNLLGQINQILDLSKLETNSLKLNRIQGDIVEFLRYSTEAFQSYANGQNLSLRFFSPVEKLQMDYDPDSIQNIMSNLISNAMKFTPDGGDVKVLLENKEQQLIIKVQDTGVGISKKDLPHIFDRFYQVKGTNGQEINGTGVGLAYVQELVKVLGGNISVESEVGKGTTFEVNLPIKKEAPIAENGIAKTAPPIWNPTQNRVDVVGDTKTEVSNFDSTSSTNGNLPHLLIIEDNADVVIYLKSCLSDLYQIEVAYNGKIGIEKAIETIPDLIISDVMMPEKDGFEVCDVLKNDERTSHIPLILLTAKADSTSKIAGLKRGADAYLSKPFDKEELLVRLEVLVERQKKMVTYFSTKNQTNTQVENVIEIEEAIQIENAFIQKVRKVVAAHYSDEDFALPQLCQKIGMSRSQLFRKMKALIDTSPSDFIRKYRLEKAKHLLETTDKNVSEVSWEVGFKDLSHFSKTFQTEFGFLPSTTSK